MKKIKKIISSALATMIICPGLNVFAELSEVQKNCPDFSQIKTQEFDSKNLDKAISELEKIASKNNFFSKSKEVKALLRTLLEEYTHLETAISIYGLNNSADITDNSANEKYMKIQDTYLEKYNDMSQCIEDLYNSGYDKELQDVDGHDFLKIFLSEEFEDMSDEEYSKMLEKNNTLISEVNNDINEYYSYTYDDIMVDYNGKTWSLNDFYNASILNDDDYYALSKLLHDKKNEIFGNIFLKILKKRNEIATLYRYDNYVDYAYENMFIRDYSSEDTDKIYALVKKYFSPYYEEIYDKTDENCMNSGLMDKSYTDKDVLDIVTNFMDQADSEFSERLEHLKNLHLYDIDDGSVKFGDSYMSSLYDYSVPFVLISPSGDYNDIISFIHEFGHANAEYEKPSSAIENEQGISIDTSEMHSQGMEVLFTHYSKQILGEELGNSMNEKIIFDMIDSIVQGCLFDEFQKYAYKNPNCSLDDLNNKFRQLCTEYGVYYSDSDLYIYDWVDISHNFDSPMYYITYATSAVSVLDLWIQSMNDMDTALSMYKNVTDCDTYTPYKEAASKCSLATIFDENALAEISYQTKYYFDNGDIDHNYKAFANYESSLDYNESAKEVSISAPSIAKPHHREHYENDIDVDIDIEDEEAVKIFVISLLGACGVYVIGLIIAKIIITHIDRKNKKR